MKLHEHAPKILRLAVLLGALGMGSASAAVSDSGWLWWPDNEGGFSYTFVQGSYGFLTDSNNQRSDVAEGRVSIGLGSFLHLGGTFLEATSQQLPETVETGYSGYLGLHGSVNEHIDIQVDLGYLYTELDRALNPTEADGPQLGFGFRGLSPAEHFEAELRYTHFWLQDQAGHDWDDGIVSFDLLWRTTSHLGLVFRGTWATDSSNDTVGSYTGGLRLWF